MNSGRHDCTRLARRLPALLALAVCALAAPSALAKLSTPRITLTPSTFSTERSGSTPSTTFQPFNFSTSSYVWGLDLDGTLQGAGGVGGLLAVIRDDGVYLPCYDANGNITEYVTTNSEVVAHYDYSPFGEQLISSGPLADTFTHRFSTKPWCADTGLNEFVYRKYRPDVGRWMNRDPLEEAGGMALYRYAASPNSIEILGLVGVGDIWKLLKRAGVKLIVAVQITFYLTDRWTSFDQFTRLEADYDVICPENSTRVLLYEYSYEETTRDDISVSVMGVSSSLPALYDTTSVKRRKFYGCCCDGKTTEWDEKFSKNTSTETEHKLFDDDMVDVGHGKTIVRETRIRRRKCIAEVSPKDKFTRLYVYKNPISSPEIITIPGWLMDIPEDQ